MTSAEEDQFENLPKFDASKFQPPAWAKPANFQWGDRNGESSKATASSADKEGNQNILDLGDDESDDDNDDSGDEVFEDAHSTVDPEEAMFTISELKVCFHSSSDLFRCAIYSRSSLSCWYLDADLLIRNSYPERPNTKLRATLIIPPNLPNTSKPSHHTN